MGEAFLHGNGGSNLLNFKVVGGTSAPSNPKENTIWVNTSTAIHAWDFAAEQPCRVSKRVNLLTYPFYHTTRTDQGITFTDNGDGTVTANGKATAMARFRPSHGAAEYGLIWLSPGTYTVSGGISNDAVVECYDHTNTKTLAKAGNTPVTFTLAEGTYARFSLLVSEGISVSNKVFKPQLERGSTATSFIKGTSTGQVWIKTSILSPVEFNALKKNNITLYPAQAYQWTGTSWEVKPAKTYQNGAWKDWEMYLYNYDKLGYTWNTAGKVISSSYGGDPTAPTVTTNSSGVMNIKQPESYDCGIAYISEKIDLTNYKTLTFNGKITTDSDHLERARLCIWSSLGTYVTTNLVAEKQATVNGTATIDISSLSGSYYIGFAVHHINSSIDVNYIKLSS